MTSHFIQSTLFLLAVSSLAPLNSANAGFYAVKDLGALTNLPGLNSSAPNAISSNGKVAAANVTNDVQRAFLYDGAWMNLGTLGGSNSAALGVNAPGLVVGRARTTNQVLRAFLWSAGGTNGPADNPQMEDLGTLGGANSGANGINDTGQITGYAQTANRDHAFRYSGGTKTDIGALLAGGLSNSYGFGINDAGHIAGIAYNVFFTAPHAFFYNGSTALDIGNLGGQAASALAINNTDLVAGYSTTSNGFDHAFHYAGGVMSDLGTLGGDYSYAEGINNSNAIVGGSFIDAVDNNIYHAFVCVSNSMLDLNTLLDASGNGWELREARAINDSGQIIGVGLTNGELHGFLLNPVPEIRDVKLSGTDVLISFTTINAATYNLAGRDDLVSGGWSDLITGIIGTGGLVTVTNSDVTSRQRFYRPILIVP